MPHFALLAGDRAGPVSTKHTRNISILADFLKAVLDIPDDEYKDISIPCPPIPYHHMAARK